MCLVGLQEREKVQVDFTHAELYTFYSQVGYYDSILQHEELLCIITAGENPGTAGLSCLVCVCQFNFV